MKSLLKIISVLIITILICNCNNDTKDLYSKETIVNSEKKEDSIFISEDEIQSKSKLFLDFWVGMNTKEYEFVIKRLLKNNKIVKMENQFRPSFGYKFYINEKTYQTMSFSPLYYSGQLKKMILNPKPNTHLSIPYCDERKIVRQQEYSDGLEHDIEPPPNCNDRYINHYDRGDTNYLKARTFGIDMYSEYFVNGIIQELNKVHGNPEFDSIRPNDKCKTYYKIVHWKSNENIVYAKIKVEPVYCIFRDFAEMIFYEPFFVSNIYGDVEIVFCAKDYFDINSKDVRKDSDEEKKLDSIVRDIKSKNHLEN